MKSRNITTKGGSRYTALTVSICAVVLRVTAFTFFMSVVKGLRYRKALFEVSVITVIVVLISLGIGMLIKLIFG